MNNSEIKEIALKQSAEDIGCQAHDFLSDKNVIVPFCLGKNARKYYKEPIICNFVSYGSNIVVATTKEVSDLVTEYIGKFEFYHCFETPNIHWLNDRLLERGYKICFMAEYYLPDVNKIPDAECLYETHILVQEDFRNLYLPEWSNALCKDRSHLDMLGIGAYDNGRLIGFAACSADCDEMWQIGIDVLPEYRQKGIASALTSKLAKEINDYYKTRKFRVIGAIGIVLTIVFSAMLMLDPFEHFAFHIRILGLEMIAETLIKRREEE